MKHPFRASQVITKRPAAYRGRPGDVLQLPPKRHLILSPAHNVHDYMAYIEEDAAIHVNDKGKLNSNTEETEVIFEYRRNELTIALDNKAFSDL